MAIVLSGNEKLEISSKNIFKTKTNTWNFETITTQQLNLDKIMS